MKFISNKFIAKIVCFLCLLSISTVLNNKTFLRASIKNQSNLSFSEVVVQIDNKDEEAEFTSNVKLLKEGILIDPAVGLNEKLLKLISEKTEDESFMVDYRLLRSCSGLESENKESVTISLSPKSLENRTTNDNLKFKMTFKRDKGAFQNLFDERKFKFNNDDSLSERLKKIIESDCEDRKDQIHTLKKSFSSEIENLREKKEALSKINKRLLIKDKEIDSLTVNLNDTKNQISDITNLQDSYSKQLKSLETLRSGTNKLIEAEERKIQEFSEQEHNLNEDSLGLINELKDTEGKYSALKKEYIQLNDEIKEAENNLTNVQRKISENEAKLSDVQSKEIKNNYELQFKEKDKTETESKIKVTSTELESMILKEDQINKDSKRITTDKSELDKEIAKTNDEIKSLEQQINELIISKTKKEESVKNLYEQNRLKEEALSKLSVEKERLRITKDELVQKEDKLKSTLEDIINKHLSKLNTVKKLLSGESNYYNNKKTDLKKELVSYIKSKSSSQDKLDQNTKRIESIEKEIYRIKKSQVDLENSKNEIAMKKKEKESKINNIKNDSINYRNELENITKSLKSSKDNFVTYSSLNQEFKEKVDPLKIKYQELLDKKKELEGDIRSQKKRIKEKAKTIKNEAPSAVIMVDMAEDDALSLDSGHKWRKLVDKIIY